MQKRVMPWILALSVMVTIITVLCIQSASALQSYSADYGPYKVVSTSPNTKTEAKYIWSKDDNLYVAIVANDKKPLQRIEYGSEIYNASELNWWKAESYNIGLAIGSETFYLEPGLNADSRWVVIEIPDTPLLGSFTLGLDCGPGGFSAWGPNKLNITIDTQLTIKKILDDGGCGTLPQTFNITVSGPNDYSLNTTVSTDEDRILTGLVYGDYTVTEQSTDYTATIDGSPAGLSMDNNTATVTITNVPKAFSVSADDVVKPYDGNSYGVTATASDIGATIKYWNDETSDYDLDSSPTITDTGELIVKFQATLSGKTATGQAKVTINPAAVTIDVNDASKVYGEADPTFTGSVSGLIGNDDLGAITYYRSNTSVNDVGYYSEVLTASYTENDNYDVTVNNGNFEITTDNAITVSFDPQGGAPTPSDITATLGSTYGTLPTVTKTDCDFQGWFTAATGGTLVTADTEVTNPSSHTLFAYWKEQEENIPGEIYLSKTATAQTNGSWKMNLSINSVDLVTTSDVILVVDCSISMNQSSRLTNAKAAAISFVNNLLPNGNNGKTRIALVSYSSNASVRQTFTTDATALKTSINSLAVDYATNSQDGFYEAEQLMASSTASNKYIVFLSDGDATQSNYPDASCYSMVNWTTHTATNHVGTGTLKSGYNTFINGAVIPYSGGSTSTYSYTYSQFYCANHGYVTAKINSNVNHNTSAINEAQNAKNAGINVYTIALSAGTTGSATMQSCATDTDHFFNTTDPTKLAKIYTDIASSIKYAATNAIVTDPMGDMFDMVGTLSNITAVDKDGNPVGTVSYDAATETITWNIGTITQAMSPITMSYYINIISSATPGQTYPTNDTTPINYTDVNGQSAEKLFPIPQVGVNAGSVYVIDYLVDENGNMITDLGLVTNDRSQARVLKSTSTTVPFGNTLHVVADSTILVDSTNYAFDSSHSQCDASPQDVLINSANNQVYIYYAYKETAASVSADGYDEVYDGNAHSITVNGADAYTLYYKTDVTSWNTTKPMFTDVTNGAVTVYVQARNGEAVVASTSATVIITPAPATIDVADSGKVFGQADPLFIGIVSGLVNDADLGTVTYNRTNATVNDVGNYAEVLDANYTANSNYNVTVNKGDFAITKSEGMTVDADDVVKIYDGNSYGVTATSNVSGATIKYWNNATSAYDLDTSPAIANVADSVLTVKFQATDANYYTVTGEATVTINPADATIDVADSGKVFGQADPLFIGIVSGLVNSDDLGTVTYNRTNATVNDVGNYAEVLDASYTANSNYNVTVNKGDFAITKSEGMTVDADDVVKTYDGNSYGVTATSNVSGATIKYWNAATSAYDLDASPAIANVADSVLTVEFQATDANYYTVTGEATVTINPADATIDVADSGKMFGQSDPAFTGTVSGLVSSTDLGTVTYNRTNATVNDVGNYAEVLDASYTANSNYNVTVNKGDFAITKSEGMTVDADDVVKTYDGNSYGVTATSNVSGATIKYWNAATSAYDLDTSPAIANVADSVLTVKFQATDANYYTVTGEATVTINPADATIDVADSGKVFGQADPLFIGIVSGLVNSDDLGTVTYNRTNATVNDVGNYAEVLDASYTANSNYNVTVNKGDFAITKSEGMTVDADDVIKTYDGNSYGVTATFNVSGATIKYWNAATSAYDLDTSPAIANVADSVLTVKFQATDANYYTVTGEATVTINPADAIIDVADSGKMFGQSDPAFTGTVSGLVSSTDLGTVTYNRTNATVNDVGNYAEVLDASYTANSNYNVTVNKGDFAITKSEGMTVDADDVIKTYDGNSYGVTATSNVSGATIKYWNAATSAYDLDTSPAIANVADSVLTVKFQATDANYYTVTGEATVTINPADATIDVADSGKVFGQADPLFIGIVSGLVNSDDLGTVTYNRTNATVNDVGSYAEVLDASYTANSNYNVTVNKGDFAITKSEGMTVDADDVIKTYDGNSYGVTATSNVSGATIKYWNAATSAYDLDTSPAIANVADSVLTVKFQATDANYYTVTGEATVTINPATITVTADAKTKYVGNTDPALTYTYTNGVNSEVPLFSGALSRVTGEAKGTYAINQNTLAFADNTATGFLASNYNLVYVSANLTIKSKSSPNPTPTPLALEKEDHFAYIKGYPDGNVRPEGQITREEVATIFYRLLVDDVREAYFTESNSFSDVAADRWSNNAISTLAACGIVTGYPDGTFQPDEPITRAEFAAIASRFDELSYTGEDKFSDIADHWAATYINSSSEKGWIKGYEDGTFRPDNYITRAESVTLINRVLERLVDEDGLLPDAKYWPDITNSDWFYYDILEATNSHDYYERDKSSDPEEWTKINVDKVWNE